MRGRCCGSLNASLAHVFMLRNAALLLDINRHLYGEPNSISHLGHGEVALVFDDASVSDNGSVFHHPLRLYLAF